MPKYSYIDSKSSNVKSYGHSFFTSSVIVTQVTVGHSPFVDFWKYDKTSNEDMLITYLSTEVWC